MMHRHLTTCWAVVGLLTIAVMVHAGAQARVEGHVTDSEGKPIKGASVIITSPEVSGFKKTAKTDGKGVFKVLILDATRNYSFRVEADGFQPEERPFKVPVGSTDNVFEFTLLTVAQATAGDQSKLLEQPGYKEFEEGKQLLRSGDNEGARAKFAEAVAAKPDLIQAQAALAELSYQAGDFKGALAAARACLAIDDESIDCLAIAVNSAGALGDEAARTEYMARYREVNPEDPTILFNEAAVFLNKLDDEGARPLLEKCLEADPDFPQCNFEYGMLLLRAGDMEGAKAHLLKYLEVAPDGPQAATAEETLKYL